MKTVYNLVCKTNKPINIINILPDTGCQHFCSQRERGTVGICYLLAARIRYDVKKFFHEWCFSIKLAANFPEINDGGTPGPGTDN